MVEGPGPVIVFQQRICIQHRFKRILCQIFRYKRVVLFIPDDQKGIKVCHKKTQAKGTGEKKEQANSFFIQVIAKHRANKAYCTEYEWDDLTRCKIRISHFSGLGWFLLPKIFLFPFSIPTRRHWPVKYFTYIRGKDMPRHVPAGNR